MTEGPHASVVVPVRNRPDLLASTLDSLVSQEPPEGSFEIVVCDDGSTDDVASVVRGHAGRGPAVRLERQPPRGPAAARNLGVRRSSASVVVFVDSDVLAGPGLVRSLVGALDAHPDWVGAEAALEPVGEGEGPLWDAPSSGGGGHYHTAAIAYRRDALVAVGGLDESFPLPACEDVELAVRMLERGPIGFVPEARALHPRRKVNVQTHWKWRRHWRYETILAVRYGILAFPGRSAGPWPRARVAVAAALTLPAGRLVSAAKALPRWPGQAIEAGGHAALDLALGLSQLPAILFGRVPPRRRYLDDGPTARESPT